LGWQLALRQILRPATVPGFTILKSSFLPKPIFSKFKYENDIKMKNKPYSPRVQSFWLSNGNIKRTSKSRETIPLIKDISSSENMLWHGLLLKHVRNAGGAGAPAAR
jgi:hypothetical protein